ncbi:MAG: FHA domain-containing protein [Kofleriaceae bacterium]|nr:FHA domain-containing protein [Kofleriaceae bacterium]
MTATSCIVCHQARELVGVACADCREELKPAIRITPEQVRMRGAGSTPALFVDAWGRVHHIARRTVIGRDPDADGFVLLDSTISRRHAVLELRVDRWMLADLGSANGTFVENRPLTAETPLRDGERVRFGGISLFFLASAGVGLEDDPSTLGGYTARGPLAPESLDAMTLTIELREPTGGGGGVAVIGGRQVQLTLAQFEFISALYRRATAAERKSDGYVHASELMQLLSLDSAEPNEDHVRQLVRRLRRVLFKAGITDLIESRYGAGYRLVLTTG